MFAHKHIPECAHTYNQTATTKHTNASKQEENVKRSPQTHHDSLPFGRQQQQQQRQISVRSVIKTHRNQGCQGTQVKLIRLIVQLSVKNGRHISLTARGTRGPGNAYD